jgi:peptidyl-dipeptidase A
MWAQQWGTIMDLLLPYPNAASVNVTDALLKANFTVVSMFQTSEEFYTSIGLEPMTNDFWTKSVIVRPTDNTEMTCHGSAEDFSTQTDFRWACSFRCSLSISL